jgi:hypothetical protein
VADLRRRERLGQVVPGTAAHGLDGRLQGGVGGDDDDRDVGVLGQQLRDQIQAALVAEAQVEEDDVVRHVGHGLQRGLGRGRLTDLAPHALDADAQGLPDVLLVVDDEDVETGHDR